MFSNGAPDANVVIKNFQSIAQILQDVGVLLGLGLFVSALFQLKRYGEMRTFMSHQMTIAQPLMTMIAGMMMLLLPTMASSFVNMFFGTVNPLAYTGDLMDWQGWDQVVIIFVRIIGVGAFIKGISMLARVGGQQGQPGMMGKALMHLIGGVMCIHVIGTLDLLEQILNISP